MTMPSERVSDGILCLKGQVMSDFLPEFEPCGIYSGLTKIRTRRRSRRQYK
ncbi:transposase [Neisseria gonorrhoeae DGI2]|uniref:Transposase n=1 Tax=Neisseria gonorrhoeae (strain NCCP11945) TaxID=521006 RepID=B4RMJ0_NEIG2|nr:Transposase [Neisseria gonorrhoeae NCCP11945]EFE04004.1 transposase [Neisseria gonorrhoeae DGI2]KDM98311.1 transposase [Neisseria gonorrhoeae]KDN00573.1 transposase [Neisseria gonorrhoeae]KDN03004.1 transposase [Neisseria gonorrhoeae]